MSLSPLCGDLHSYSNFHFIIENLFNFFVVCVCVFWLILIGIKGPLVSCMHEDRDTMIATINDVLFNFFFMILFEY